MRIALVFKAILSIAVVATQARAAETTTYTYDALGRLTGTSIAGSVNSGVATDSAYDPAGNRDNYNVSGVPTGLAILSINNVAVTEGGGLSFTVTRSGVTSSAVAANFASASGSAASGADFAALSGTVSFAAGEVSKTLVVSTIDDGAGEASETLTVALSAPSSGAMLGISTGTGTINDND